ncbi:MAG: hypothetical protein EAZ35_02130 [Sphingobacteriia bacterium]|nr:MAG: hypothetical protein EAZ35_02130 [Sphingobacteriia bacterium]
MKKTILFFAILFAAIAVQAQKIDTVQSAILVNPVVVNALTKDTAFQVSWSAFGITRDTSKGCNTYVQVFDRKAKRVMELNIPIPAKTLQDWDSDIIIDNYILTFLGLTKKL